MVANLEIERRFLVDGREEKPWRINSKHSVIIQHYLPSDALELSEFTLSYGGKEVLRLSKEEQACWMNHTSWTTRLRHRDGVFILTCKAKVRVDAADELEWVLPNAVAASILATGSFPFVQKTRYEWTGGDGNVWEVDEFEGGLAGLVLAEVELEESDSPVLIPSWVGQEITGLKSWSNAALSRILMSQVDD